MSKPSYRIIPQPHGRAYDVEMSLPGEPARIVNTFNTEADAWQWVNEQRHVERIARRLARDPDGHGRAQ
jgi:hypothetical protein